MPIPIKPDEVVRYQLRDDRNEDGTENPNEAVFLLGTLSAVQWATVQDILYTASIASGRLPAGTQELEVVRCGLKGWERWSPKFPELLTIGPEGCQYSEIPKTHTHALSVLQPKHRKELQEEILRRQRLGPEEGK